MTLFLSMERPRQKVHYKTGFRILRLVCRPYIAYKFLDWFLSRYSWWLGN